MVAKNYRNQNLGSKHLKENKIYLQKAGKPAFLLCKKVNKFLCKKWLKLIVNKNFRIKNYKKKYLMSFNFNSDKKNMSTKFILNLKWKKI